MSNTQSLQSLMVEELRDIYDAEKQLVKALPKMAKGAASESLRQAIETHLEETKGHVNRLEQVFTQLGEPARGKHCAGVAGIIEEGCDLLASKFEAAVKDAGIVAAAQRAEHYEIGTYGSIITWARLLGRDDLAGLLHKTLDEEKGADRTLTQLAEGGINSRAASGNGAARSAAPNEYSPQRGRTARRRRPQERR